jgi:hypothetical protein
MVHNTSNGLVDPDPFAIGFALLGLLFSGGSFLEVRRQRRLAAQRRGEDYRHSWFAARRTLLHARRVTDEFATYVAEFNLGGTEFRFGEARIDVPEGIADQMRRLHGHCMTTAGQMGDRLDALSAFLDSSYEPIVRKIMDRLSEIQMPHSYDAVLILVNDGISLFDELINSIGENEGFVS